MSPPTDEELLSAHLAGEPTAFRTLVERHHPELFRFVARFTSNGAAAEDVVQDAFVQVHLAGAKFDPARKLKPWLYTIAANKARDYIRGRSRRKEVSLDATIGAEADSEGRRFLSMMADDGPGPEAHFERQEVCALVRKTIEELSPPLREILILAYFHQFSYKEIAEIAGIPLGTVKSRLHAAVGRFGKGFREGQNRDRGEDV